MANFCTAVLIPKGSRNKDAAIEFIKFASSTKALADMVSYLRNGPTRKSSLALLSSETLNQIPNGPAYDDKPSIFSDAEWWARNHSRQEEAFKIWTAASARRGAAGTVRQWIDRNI